jgi:hypothetical protein
MESPLGCILKNWDRFDSSTFRKRRLIFFAIWLGHRINEGMEKNGLKMGA